MSSRSKPAVSRRSFLAGCASLALASSLPSRPGAAAPAVKEFRLVAGEARAPLLGAPYRDTAVWAYNGRAPGPELRVRQGDRVRVLVENRLPEDTTVHWHGVRVPHAMDGVPHLTQAPIRPGETFAYEFACQDAGTFWYHPHHNSSAQLGRGLYGTLIVEEREPPRVDRDVTWVLDDWRLRNDAAISGNFNTMHDVSHGGRLGNVVTVNGAARPTFAAHSGERIRLRLVNVANGRIFSLSFAGHAPTVVALDGHPVEPHEPADGRVLIGPAMRVDLVLDMAGEPGSRHRVADGFYRGGEGPLLDILYSDRAPRTAPAERLGAVAALPSNPVPEPSLASARRLEMVLGGGMGLANGAKVDGKSVDFDTLVGKGLFWAINGVAATGHHGEPLATLERGRSHVAAIVNDTGLWHPMHLHGHTFRVISRDGRPTRHREWQDTVLVAPRERVEIAFVADNPGDWIFHCHVLEHQAGGMTGTIRVA